MSRSFIGSFVVILLFLLEALAGGGQSRSRNRQPPQLTRKASTSLPRFPSLPLPQHLGVPALPDTEFDKYLQELPQSLARLHFPNTQVRGWRTDPPTMLRLADAVRAQMTEARGKKRQFIPIMARPRGSGQWYPAKVYAMPLSGKAYRGLNIPPYGGQQNTQSVAFLGLTHSPEGMPNGVVYMGLAEVFGAPSLDRDLPRHSDTTVHSLHEFLDPRSIAPGLPNFRFPQARDGIVQSVHEAVVPIH